MIDKWLQQAGYKNLRNQWNWKEVVTDTLFVLSLITIITIAVTLN